MSSLAKEPVAVIGIGCRLPGEVRSARDFWALLEEGRDALTPVPPHRFDMRVLVREGSIRGGFLADVESFEPGFFGISAREARQIDPQQRLLLEVSQEALEDAGLDVPALRGSRTGVFIGICTNEYGAMQSEDTMDVHSSTGSATSLASNRVSYALGLRGPSISVDTACSSSLSAVHLACQSLWNGDADCALAGGVGLLLEGTAYSLFTRSNMLSRKGRCAAFDAEGDGFVRSEGAAVVVLKPLAQARADGDRIEALILATGANSDGKTAGISLPSEEGQAELLIDCYRRAGLDPERLAFVEAHGTGTPAGDPVEGRALAAILGRNHGNPLWIGSVKTNLGHTEAASGVTGLVKAVLALKHRRLPANLHFQTPHPDLDWTRLAVPRETVPLPDGEILAGVNSFGFGGANAHVILASAPSQEAPPAPRRARILPLSAHRPDSLPLLAARYAAELPGQDAEAVGRTAALRRTHQPFRLAVVGESAEDWARELQALDRQPKAAATAPRTVFVYCGHGSEWSGMGLDLYETEPVFRECLDRCEAGLRRWGGWSLLELLRDPEGFPNSTEFVQPAIFSIQAGLTALWRSWGIEPAAVIGHSVGEVAAAWAASALTLDEALRLLVARGRHMARAGAGAMLAVGCSAEEAARWLSSEIELAAENGPDSVTLAGSEASIAALQSELESQNMFCRRLEVRHAFHTGCMDAIRAGLFEELGSVQADQPFIPWFSSLTGAWVEEPPELDYWWRNLREPVHFRQAVEGVRSSGDLFLEVGPHPVLARSLQDCAPDLEALGSLRRKRDGNEGMARALAALYERGAAVRWSNVYRNPHPPLSLPPTQFVRERYWAEGDSSRARRQPASFHPLLGVPEPGPVAQWKSVWSPEALAYFQGHQVAGEALVPGAAMVEALLRAAPGKELADLRIEWPMQLNRITSVRVVPYQDRLALYTRSAGEKGEWIRHCSARVSGPQAYPSVRPRPASGWELTLDQEQFYALCARHGHDYGPDYRLVRKLRLSATVAHGRIDAPPGTPWPIVSDAVNHVALSFAFLRPAAAWLPDRVERMRVVDEDPSGTIEVWANLRPESSGQTMFVDLVARRPAGRTVSQSAGLRLRRRPLAVSEPLARLVRVPLWRPANGGVDAPGAAARAQTTLTEAAQRQQKTLEICRLQVEPVVRGAIAAALQAVPQKDYHRKALERLRAIHATHPCAPWSAEEIAIGLQKARQAAPKMGPSLAQLERVLPRLADVLEGKVEALELVYPGGSSDPLFDFYCHSVEFEPCHEAVQAALGETLFRPGSRVLELGAGSGGGTHHALQTKAMAEVEEYWFSDVSSAFFEAARRRLGARRSLRFAPFDLNRSAEEQRFVDVPFDAALAYYALHTASDVTAALRHVGAVLRPGGLLMLMEGEGMLLQHEIVMMLLEGWWTDRPAERPTPMLRDEQWREALQAAGYQNVSVVHDDHGLFQLILAEAPQRLSSEASDAPVYEIPSGLTDPVPAAAELLRRVPEKGPWRIVTRAAHAILPGEVPDPVARALWSLTPTLIAERPQLELRVLDCGVDTTPAEVEAWAREPGPELTTAIRQGQRYDYRMPAPQPVRPANYRVEAQEAGWEALVLAPCDRPIPSPGRVLIEVEQAALNFRDVLQAMGLVPCDWPFLPGLEAAGRVIECGPGMESWLGKRVVTQGEGLMARYALSGPLLAEIPKHLGGAQAAGATAAYLTAHYALFELARLKPGERVLIHSAAGGLGLAALRLVLQAGGVPICTAGSPQKRDYLRSQGVKEVYDSRSTDWPQHVLDGSDGQGLDVILNSLAGPAIEAGLSLLNDQGRFCELGKRDLLGDRPLGLGSLSGDKAFFTVNLPDWVRRQPQAAQAALESLLERVEPLPCEEFPVSQARLAFETMARGQHIGKLVLSFAENPARLALTARPPRVRPDATYLITGGTGGLGMRLADWLVDQGARHLLLLSRSGRPAAEDEARLAQWRALGVAVRLEAVDVRDGAALESVLQTVEPVLGGVFHSTLALDDTRLENLDEARLRPVVEAKALAAEHLDRLTRGCPLDFFVMFSSSSVEIGLPGQTAYNTGNGFLSGLAERRRAEGLPALVLEPGTIGDCGYLTRNPELLQSLRSMGAETLNACDVLAALEWALGEPWPIVTVGRMAATWRQLTEFRGGPLSARAENLDLRESAGEDAEAGPSGPLSTLPREEWRAQVGRRLLLKTARILETNWELIPTSVSMLQLGLDSLMAVELRNWIERELGVGLSSMELMRGPSLEELADLVHARLCEQS